MPKVKIHTPVRRTEAHSEALQRWRITYASQLRNWLKSSHASYRSWERVAREFGLSSKGTARRIALGEAEIPLSVLERFLTLRIYREAARTLGKLERSRAIGRAVKTTGKSVATYDKNGKEVKG